jgi:hypothetical protein
VAISVMTWVWNHSQSRHGSRLVLLAIADSMRNEDGWAWPSVKELSRKTALKERGVQTAIADLVKLGELEVAYNEGPKGCNRYRVLPSTPAESAPPQNLHPAVSTPPQNSQGQQPPQVTGQTPAESAPPAENAGVQNPARPPAESAPGTVREPKDKNSPTESSLDGGPGEAALFDAPEGRRQRRKTAAKQPAATRIPDDFAITPEMQDWAAERIPGFGIDAETENFIDWWRSKPGAAAMKTDWVATWRTWMRRAAKESGGRQQSGSPSRGRQYQGKQTNYTDEEYRSGWL